MNFRSTTAALFLLCELCISCATRKENTDMESAGTEAQQPQASDHRASDSSMLQGLWWRVESDSPAFFIKGDSLYYTDDQTSPYFISIQGNRFELSQVDVAFTLVIKKMTADSLIFYDAALGEDIGFYKKD